MVSWIPQMDKTRPSIVPPVSPEAARRRRELRPDQFAAFRTFSKAVFSAGALDVKTKQLLAVAVAHVTQCPHCIEGHTRQALAAGATPEEIMESIWVAAEMRAGAAYAHSAIAMETLEAAEARRDEPS